MRQLEELTIHQSEVIDQKTREGIYLERLTSQFSPQVIDSIKSGEINIDTKERRQVTCIFIDVQNSTNRASRLDHQNYSTLLTDFFGECVNILLKHNVTVGTYQGDGIMAITNAPSDDPRSKENALAACLELLVYHDKIKKHYFAKWRTEFNVRIGLETGWATVGFFPSRKYGAYTALGDSTNLAARLCARAPLNSIAVTKSFLSQIEMPDSTVEIKDIGHMSDLKGFEGEVFDVVGLTPVILRRAQEHECPHCEKPLVVSGIQVGGQFLKCVACNYRELMTTQENFKKDVA